MYLHILLLLDLLSLQKYVYEFYDFRDWRGLLIYGYPICKYSQYPSTTVTKYASNFSSKIWLFQILI